MSMAVPVATPGERQTAYSAIEELRDDFRRAQRSLRFELFDRYLPGHASILDSCGFENDGIDPILILTRSAGITGSTSTRPESARSLSLGVERRLIHSDDPLSTFRDFVHASRLAFGPMPGGVPEEEEAIAVSRDLARGRIRCAAITINGRIVSVATAVGVGAAVELAGVGTIPEFRRQGYAEAVSTLLIDDTFSRSCSTSDTASASDRSVEPIVWLTAGSDDAERVYRKAGFVRIGANQINFRDTK